MCAILRWPSSIGTVAEFRDRPVHRGSPVGADLRRAPQHEGDQGFGDAGTFGHVTDGGSGNGLFAVGRHPGPPRRTRLLRRAGHRSAPGRDRAARPGHLPGQPAAEHPGLLLQPRTPASRRRGTLPCLAAPVAARGAVQRPAADRAGPGRGLRGGTGPQPGQPHRPPRTARSWTSSRKPGSGSCRPAPRAPAAPARPPSWTACPTTATPCSPRTNVARATA